MKNSLKKLLLLLFLILISPVNLFANETIVLATGEWPPYTSEKDPQGKIAEVILIEAFKLKNINVVCKYVPWKRAYKYTERGEVVGTFPWTKTKEREKDLIIFTKEPLISVKTVFFHLKSLDFKWNDYNDIKKYRVGATLGYSDVEFLKEKGVKVDIAPKEVLNFKKLLGNRIDIVPSAFLVGYNIINKTFTQDKALLFTNSPKPLYTENDFLVISKKIPNGQKIADTFDSGLRELKQSGKYDEIIMKFVSIK